MKNLQPTGILAKIIIRHEKGAVLESFSLNAKAKELGIAPSRFDNSTNFSLDSEITVYNKKYVVTKIDLQFTEALNSNRVPDIDPATYFTDTIEPLPVNLMIHLTVKPT